MAKKKHQNIEIQKNSLNAHELIAQSNAYDGPPEGAPLHTTEELEAMDVARKETTLMEPYPMIDEPIMPKEVKHSTPVMKIREINLERATEEILREVENEGDLFVLQQAMTREKNTGNRASVLGALETRGTALRSHGDGAEGPEYDIQGYPVKHPDRHRTPLFDKKESHSGPDNFNSHDQGSGSEANPKVGTKAERMMGEIEKAEAKRRMNTSEDLFRIEEITKSGAIHFRWGHIMPPQREVKDDEGKKVLVRRRPSLIYLKNCPRCGKVNRPEQGRLGVCGACELSIIPYVRTEVGNNPGKYPGVVLE